MTKLDINKAVEKLTIDEREALRRHITKCNQSDRNKKSASQMYYYEVSFALAKVGGKKTEDTVAVVKHQSGKVIPDMDNVIYWDREAGNYRYSDNLLDQLRASKYITGDTFRVSPVLKASGKKFSKNTKVWS